MTTQKNNVHEESQIGSHSIRFLVRHPKMNLSFLSEATGLSPNLNWIKGAERKTPTGKLLPGAHQNSTWSYSLQLREPSFASAVERVLANIEKATDRLAEIGLEGGTASLILDLDGRSNIGDSFSPQLLARIAALGLQLGIEVYPNNNLGQ